TPPIELVSDAYLLAEYCDTTLYVMRHAFTPKAKLKHLNQNERLRAAENLGIVFTGVKSRGFIKSEYGYGYTSGYNYHYGQKFQKKDHANTNPVSLNLKKLINYNTTKTSPDLG